MAPAFCHRLRFGVYLPRMQDTNIYTYLTPIALFFVLLEVAAAIALKRDYLSFPEAIANFARQALAFGLIGAGLVLQFIGNFAK